MNWILFLLVLSSLFWFMCCMNIMLKLLVVAIKDLPLEKKNMPSYHQAFFWMFMVALFAALL